MRQGGAYAMYGHRPDAAARLKALLYVRFAIPDGAQNVQWIEYPPCSTTHGIDQGVIAAKWYA